MGTNFYLTRSEPCHACGHVEDDPLHIGKSSLGWCFALTLHPDQGVNNVDDWVPLLRNKYYVIRNEYGDQLTYREMMDVITEREHVPFEGRMWHGYENEADFHARNYSERGPKGLLRHRIDGKHCIGHGEGTWDYMVGWFR